MVLYVCEKNSEVIKLYTKPVESCSQRISKALSIRGMKQMELCTLAKIPKSSLSLYLSGAYEPKQDRLYDMAQVLDVDPVWLMGFDVPMEKENLSPDKQELTEGEKLVLELFRKIPEDRQPEALELLQVALKMQKKL